jgi:glycosyltransferase involved in cell wall biosynthesis
MRETYESLLMQTFQDFDVTVVQSEANACVNRNKGAALTRSELLLFLDADIVLHPTYMEELIRALDENPHAAYAYCRYARQGLLTGYEGGGAFDAQELREHNYISTMSIVRRADFPGWDEELERLQDWALWLKMLNKGLEGTDVDEVLFTATYLPGDTSTQNNWEESVEAVRRCLSK